MLDIVSYVFRFDKWEAEQHIEEVILADFPAGHYEMKISCDHLVALSGGLSCPGLHLLCLVYIQNI